MSCIPSPRRSLALAGTWTCLLVALTPVTFGVAGTRCANQIVDTIESPDGSLKAVVFVRACSAPARFSTQVSILKKNRRLANVAGNVFMCSGSYGLSASADVPRVTAQWASQELLVIRYPPEAEILEARPVRHRVRVRYEPAS